MYLYITVKWLQLNSHTLIFKFGGSFLHRLIQPYAEISAEILTLSYTNCVHSCEFMVAIRKLCLLTFQRYHTQNVLLTSMTPYVDEEDKSLEEGFTVLYFDLMQPTASAWGAVVEHVVAARDSARATMSAVEFWHVSTESACWLAAAMSEDSWEAALVISTPRREDCSRTHRKEYEVCFLGDIDYQYVCSSVFTLHQTIGQCLWYDSNFTHHTTGVKQYEYCWVYETWRQRRNGFDLNAKQMMMRKKDTRKEQEQTS